MLDDIKVWLTGAFLAGIVVPWIIKASAAAVSKYFGGVLDRSLALEKVKDPVLRGKLEHVALSVVDVLEYVTPDTGKGKDKFAKADAMLAKVPMLASLPEIRAQLIEWACKMMWAADEEMKKRLPGIDGGGS